MLSVAPRTPYYYCTVLLLCVISGNTFAGKTTRVSVASSGAQANYGEGLNSSSPVISADGRFVAFTSSTRNLVAGDTNGTGDVFVRDRLTMQTTRVSVDSNGIQGSSVSWDPSISANGRYVAFSSWSNLAVGTSGFGPSIYLHDRLTKQTTCVIIGLNGAHADALVGGSYPVLSADGRYVAFLSNATNLVAGDTNNVTDTFVYDRSTKQTTRVSVASDGTQGNGYSSLIGGPSLSADGRYVAFSSKASNLVAGDTNSGEDIFVHDRLTKQTTRVSVASNGVESATTRGVGVYFPSLSADGRYVAFSSGASDLVAGYLKNYGTDIFVHDRLTKQTTLVSLTSNGTQSARFGSGARSDHPKINADGRFVAFASSADDLVAGDTNDASDVFVHNRLTTQTSRVSVNSNGEQGQRIFLAPASYEPSISADGRYVAFTSAADNLVAGDTNLITDTFVRDRLLDTVHHADLKIETTQKPAALAPNSNGAYTYTITNNGPDAVNNVNITHLVSGGRAVSFTPSQGSCTTYATLNLCRMGNLLAGNSFTLQAVVKASGNPLVQKVTVRGEPVDAVPTNNLVSVSTTVTP